VEESHRGVLLSTVPSLPKPFFVIVAIILKEKPGDVHRSDDHLHRNFPIGDEFDN